eukprot:Phypoly_transcript_12352.p1 GENE.Phypoly_transcript_12352~~Phypoly_transcript_12352.p1  ORF type:complete len:332 (+),score=73.17 Phypoly_transcript_12352:116-1111(+)
MPDFCESFSVGEGVITKEFSKLQKDLEDERKAHKMTKQELSDLLKQFDAMLDDMNNLQIQVLENERKSMVELETACKNLDLDDKLKTTQLELSELKRAHTTILEELHNCQLLLEKEQEKYATLGQQKDKEITIQQKCKLLDQEKSEEVGNYNLLLEKEKRKCQQLERANSKLMCENNALKAKLDEIESATLLANDFSFESSFDSMQLGAAVMAKVQKGENARCWEEGTIVGKLDKPPNTYQVEYYNGTRELVPAAEVVPFLGAIQPITCYKKGDMAIAWRRNTNDLHLGNWLSVRIESICPKTNSLKVVWVDREDWPISEIDLDEVCPISM